MASLWSSRQIPSLERDVRDFKWSKEIEQRTGGIVGWKLNRQIKGSWNSLSM